MRRPQLPILSGLREGQYMLQQVVAVVGDAGTSVVSVRLSILRKRVDDMAKKTEEKVVVRYVEDEFGSFTLHRRPVPKTGPSWFQRSPGQSEEGYGDKITTDIMLKLRKDNRLRRVYAICWSNAASHYILIRGKAFYLRGHYVQSDILDT